MMALEALTALCVLGLRCCFPCENDSLFVATCADNTLLLVSVFMYCNAD